MALNLLITEQSMANPYTQNNPYFSQSADIGYPQVDYQPSTQDTSMQDMFHNQAMQQMGQLASGQSVPQSGMNPMALAQMLRNMGQEEDRLKTSGYGTQSGATANPSQWTYGVTNNGVYW